MVRVVGGCKYDHFHLEHPVSLADGAINPCPLQHTVVCPELVHALPILLVTDPCAAVYVACSLGYKREGRGGRGRRR